MSIGIGVIGTGRMGSIRLDSITSHLADVRLAAISGADAHRTAAAAQRFGATNFYTDAFALIDDPAVHAVVISSPAATHAELAIAAVTARKPVFVEKPLSTSSGDALRVVNEEVTAGRRYIRLGFMRRYDPGYLELSNTVSSGVIGSPLMIHCAHRLAAVPQTFTSEMLITEGLTHEIDVARWLSGHEITSVRVHTPGPSGRAAPGVADPQFVVMETDGGALINVEVSVNAGYAYDIRCEVACEDGTAELGEFSTVRLRRGGHAAAPLAQNWMHRFSAAFRTELRSWIDDVVSGELTGPTAWDGYAAAAVADASVRSLHERVDVSVALAPQPDLYALNL